MIRWGDNPRDFDSALAVWPAYRGSWGRWIMQELVERPDGPPQWRDRRVPTEDGGVRVDVYDAEAEARAAADHLNPALDRGLSSRVMEETARTSLILKTRKSLQSKQRLAEEEALMLAEALRRNAEMVRPSASDLKLVPAADHLRDSLAEQLQAMPYLRVALLSDGWRNVTVYRDLNDVWSKPYWATDRTAQQALRARIANGFGFHHAQHWGQVKAKIRQMLLPRANQLLQLASVQRLLAEALAAGHKVLVSNGIVFWYEEDGQIGWQVKETASDKGHEGDTLWREGTIQSRNHGRLVILPYIKESGERVSGHTRNAPGDGRAKPRHPDHYVDIPFQSLDGDLMIGLFGELPYE